MATRPSMPSSSDRPILRVVLGRICYYKNIYSHRSRTNKSRKTSQSQKQQDNSLLLSKPTVDGLIKELEELKLNLTSALAEEPHQTMATSVLTTLRRRIKKYEKKHDHIVQVEKSGTSGETPKKEQEELLLSKPIVMALMKELRELSWPLVSALANELRQALEEELPQICGKKDQFDAFTNTDNPIDKFLRLVNLAMLSDVKSQFSSAMLMHRYDKGCLMYDYMTHMEVQLLSENDHKFISLLDSLVTSQPAHEIDYLTDTTTCSYLVSESTSKREGGGSKREEKMDVCAKTPSPCPFGLSCWAMKPCPSGTSAQVMDEAIKYWDTLHHTERRGFLVVSASKLDQYCALLGSSWLRDFLSDATLFYKLHGSWKIHICPKPGCFRWFKEDKSLVDHLKSDHFPIFHGIDMWRSPEDISPEERCVDALRKMVWKPIHLQSALDLLSRMYLDHTCVSKAGVCDGCNQFCSLKWPLSKDPVRSKLLKKLGKSFQGLLDKEKKASYSLLSRGYLRKMTALAFENILTHLAPSDRVFFLGCILAHSPLSFCFLGEKALSFFVGLVSKMGQFVMQVAVCSGNGKLNSNQNNFNWNNREIDVVSFSVDDDCFILDPAKTKDACCGQGSIPSWLCNTPCCCSITQIPAKASKAFEKVEDKLISLTHSFLAVKSRFSALITEKKGASFRYPWLQRDFKTEMELLELDQLQRECELESLEPQIRYVCSLDLRMYILPLMRSLMWMRLLYKVSTTCKLEVSELEEHFAEILTKISSEEGFTEEEADSDEESDGTTIEGYSNDEDSEGTMLEEYSNDEDSEDLGILVYSDCEASSNTEDTAWKMNPTLDNIDLTLREGLGRANEDPGTFFWIPISDIFVHSEQTRLDGRSGDWWEGITQFKHNKSWKFMYCYHCNKSFLDWESHMLHMEHEHQLGISYGKSWFVPIAGKEFNFSQVGIEGDLDMEGFVTLDRTYSYFLVDITKFYELKVNDNEELDLRKQKQFMDVLKGLQDQVSDINCLLSTKSKHLRSLEVVHCLHEILFNGDHSLELLVTWLHKLSVRKSHVGTSHIFQSLFLCRVLQQAQAPLSNDTVKHAFAHMQHLLITKLCELDRKIKKLIVQKDNSWRRLSDLSVCDYRSKFLPSVRSFIHEKFGIDGNLFSSICNEIQNLLSNLGYFGHFGVTHYDVEEVYPGKVVISRMKSKSHWCYAYIGLHLKFCGEWLTTEDHTERFSGSVRFDGLSNWDKPGFESIGKVSFHIKPKISKFTRSFFENSLRRAVSAKLHQLQENLNNKLQSGDVSGEDEY